MEVAQEIYMGDVAFADQYAERQRFIEQERFRKNLQTALERLELALSVEMAGATKTDQSAIEQIATIWLVEHPNKVIEWIYHRTLSDHEQALLLSSLTSAVENTNRLPARERALVDRMLYRLLHKVSLSMSIALVVICLNGTRKMRRRAAYRSLRSHGTPSELGILLWTRYQETADQEALNLLACSVGALAQVDPRQLLIRTESKYFRARLFESLLVSGDDRGLELSLQYPIEFAWAVGRVGNSALLPGLRALIDANENDPEFIWSCMWAMSKMPSETDVERIRPIVSSLIERAPTIEEYVKRFRITETPSCDSAGI